MTTSLISVITATIAVFGIITLAFILVDTLHSLFWELKRDDDRD